MYCSMDPYTSHSSHVLQHGPLHTTFLSYIAAFEQQGRIQYTDPKLGVTGTNRACTKTRELIAKYKLGSPMAANYFLAEHDEYVPLLYKKMAENEKKEKSCWEHSINIVWYCVMKLVTS